MDKNEFISLVLPLKDRLFRVAWCILRSKEEAEDIVQDVMLKVWRDEKGKVENLAAYCYTMARNLALNRLVLKDNRSKELEGAYEQEVQEQPLENIIRTEKMKLLYRMIDGLPGLQRDVVQLRDMEGLSYRDIAKTLQVTEEQVKVHFALIDTHTSAIVENPKDARTRFSRALDFYLVQDFASSIEDLTQAILLDDSFFPAYFMRSLVRCKQLEYQKAEEANAASATPATLPGISAPQKSEVSALDYDIVKSDLDHVITLAPDFVYAYYNRANVLAMLKDYRAAIADYDKAIEFYKKTIEVDPNYAEAYSNLGLIYCLQAQDFSEKATTDINDPKYKEDQATLKTFYEKAKPYYEKARELKPDQKDLWLNGLYRVYYNLQMGPEFEEIEKLM